MDWRFSSSHVTSLLFRQPLCKRESLLSSIHDWWEEEAATLQLVSFPTTSLADFILFSWWRNITNFRISDDSYLLEIPVSLGSTDFLEGCLEVDNSACCTTSDHLLLFFEWEHFAANATVPWLCMSVWLSWLPSPSTSSPCLPWLGLLLADDSLEWDGEMALLCHRASDYLPSHLGGGWPKKDKGGACSCSITPPGGL